MVKFLLCAAGGLGIAFLVMSLLYAGVKRNLEILEGERNAFAGKALFLEKEIEIRNEKAAATDKRLREIEAAAAKEVGKGCFDWGSDISRSSVIKRLQAD